MTANSIDNALSRLQSLALQCTSVKIKGAPQYPVEDVAVLPLSIVYMSGGQVTADEATTAIFNPATINVDFHFSATGIGQAYFQADQVAIEYGRRLCGDPTLGGAVDTIMFPVTFDVSPAQWDKVTTLLLRFSIPVKLLETPQAST